MSERKQSFDLRLTRQVHAYWGGEEVSTMLGTEELPDEQIAEIRGGSRDLNVGTLYDLIVKRGLDGAQDGYNIRYGLCGTEGDDKQSRTTILFALNPKDMREIMGWMAFSRNTYISQRAGVRQPRCISYEFDLVGVDFTHMGQQAKSHTAVAAMLSSQSVSDGGLAVGHHLRDGLAVMTELRVAEFLEFEPFDWDLT